MKTNPDPDNEDPLLEAVLRDDSWRAASAAGKAEALGVFAARQRVRRWTRRGGGLAALAVVAACAAHWLAGPAAPPPRLLAVRPPGPPPAQPEKSIYLTDGELLALFPEGSCFLAEVDGKKKLVFFDPEVEREYVSDAGAPRSIAP
ncbi:MAG: hypothetical protein ABSG78_03650 [Verrucomicrobiota bacterium]|jgi:hypothetical protein